MARVLEQHRLNNRSASCILVGVFAGLQFGCCSASIFSRRYLPEEVNYNSKACVEPLINRCITRYPRTKDDLRIATSTAIEVLINPLFCFCRFPQASD